MLFHYSTLDPSTDYSSTMDDSARGGGGGGEDDQQIASAAEAMVQLSGFYGQHTDESMDVDPNYDPSDFLGNLREPREQKPQLDIDIAQYEMSAFQSGSGGGDVPASDDMSIDRKPQAIHDDLAISDSDEEDVSDFLTIKPEPATYQDNTNQMNSQGLTMMSNTEPTLMEQQQQQMQPPPPMQPSAGTGSDPAPNNDDDANDDLLWF